MRVSVSLPPRPFVFHGRESFVNDAVRWLTGPSTARLAVLGSGGMGKTSVLLTLLHDLRVAGRFQGLRFFLSCEALIDADSIVVSLAKLLEIPASPDLLASLIAHLTAAPRVLLTLDNLETVWLAAGGPSSDVEDLLGRLAQVPSLSLIITCRGIVLPQSVKWSNSQTATLEPFSVEAALETFKDRSGRRLIGADQDIAKELVDAVDRMPLAVSLLGQLARRGTPILELLNRWNSEHSALLRTHGNGRNNNVEVSVRLSIAMLSAADDSKESLQLLSVCCMLPDGLRPEVFDRLHPHFKYIERAREILLAYSLASLDSDRTLKTLSPVRHFVLEHHPAQPNHRDALHAVYFDISELLPAAMDETSKDLAIAAAPEMGNLSSLLLTVVSQPSQRVVDAVLRLTHFTCLQQPTLKMASALLPYLESHPQWKARCLAAIGRAQITLGEYKTAIASLAAAEQLHQEVGDRAFGAWCKFAAAKPYRLLGEYDSAESLVNQAREEYAELGSTFEEIRCRVELGELMRMKEEHSTAIKHLTVARQAFDSLGKMFNAAECSDAIGIVYLEQGKLEYAAAEFNAARSVFVELGDQNYVAQTARFLGSVRRQQGDLKLAEQLLVEAELFYEKSGDRLGLGVCAEEFGYLRHDQQRLHEAISHFRAARSLYAGLHVWENAQNCHNWTEFLEETLCSMVKSSE